MADVTYPVAVGAGLISFLSPCVLPLAPPYLCYLAGASLDELTANDKLDNALAKRVFIASIVFVLGFATVFVTLGAAASVIGQVLRAHLNTLAIVAGVMIIIMGLHFLGVFKISALYKEARYQPARPAGILGAYFMGVAFAFGWTPCIGPVLSAILAVAAVQDTVGEGALLLAGAAPSSCWEGRSLSSRESGRTPRLRVSFPSISNVSGAEGLRWKPPSTVSPAFLATWAGASRWDRRSSSRQVSRPCRKPWWPTPSPTSWDT